MSIRYQADNDLNQLIVAATFRKEPGIDFKTAQNAQLDRLGDVTVLRQSASEGRILDDEVGRLQIPVDDAGGVGSAQGLRDLHRVFQYFR